MMEQRVPIYNKRKIFKMKSDTYLKLNCIRIYTIFSTKVAILPEFDRMHRVQELIW